MATDVAVSAEPVHRLNLVWEARFLYDPRSSNVWDDAYTNGAGIRSAYLLRTIPIKIVSENSTHFEPRWQSPHSEAWFASGRDSS